VATIIFVSVALIIFGTDFLNYLVEKGIIRSGLEYTLIEIGKWIMSIAMVFFSISFIYYMAPAKKLKFRLISAGSTLATLLLVLTSLGFNYFVSNFGRYNALYGSIGTLIVIMLFIYFNAFILLLGFELNASIRYAARIDYKSRVEI
jgi:membrane protein